MQNRIKSYKNDLFEEIEFQEIEEKSSKFGEFGEQSSPPARMVAWGIPSVGETLEKEARKFKIYPIAIKIGQTIAYVLIILLSAFGQVIWFIVQAVVSVLVHVLAPLFGQRHVPHVHRQGQTTDWRDVPTGQSRKGSNHVCKDSQGHQTKIDIHINVKNQ